MAAKTELPYPTVEVSVAFITDEAGRVLVDYNDHWGAFSLPMSKRRELPPEVEGGAKVPESNLAAAVRSVAEVLGQPIDPQRLARMDVDVPAWNRSGRDGLWKRYRYTVYAFTTSEEIRPVAGHTAVWVTRTELLTLAPFSPSVALIANSLPH